MWARARVAKSRRCLARRVCFRPARMSWNRIMTLHLQRFCQLSVSQSFISPPNHRRRQAVCRQVKRPMSYRNGQIRPASLFPASWRYPKPDIGQGTAHGHASVVGRKRHADIFQAVQSQICAATAGEVSKGHRNSLTFTLTASRSSEIRRSHKFPFQAPGGPRLDFQTGYRVPFLKLPTARSNQLVPMVEKLPQVNLVRRVRQLTPQNAPRQIPDADSTVG